MKHPFFKDLRDKERRHNKISDKAKDPSSMGVRYNRVLFGTSKQTQDDEDNPSHTYRKAGRKLEQELSDKHLPSIRNRKNEENDEPTHHNISHSLKAVQHETSRFHSHALHKEDSMASVSSDVHLETDRELSLMPSALPPIGPSLSMHSITGKSVVKLQPPRRKLQERSNNNATLYRHAEKKSLEKSHRANYNFPSGRGSYGQSQYYARIKHHHKRKAKEKELNLQVTGNVRGSQPHLSKYGGQPSKYISPYSRRALAQAQ